MKSIYIIGSLRNEKILEVDKALTDIGLETFSDWYSAGRDADDYLRDYYRKKNLSYSEVLASYSAQHIFGFDKLHLNRCDSAILVMPAGRSGHLELGYATGLGKPTYILMDEEPERVDIMHNFCTKVFMEMGEMIDYFKSERSSTDSLQEETRGTGNRQEPIRRHSLHDSSVWSEWVGRVSGT